MPKSQSSSNSRQNAYLVIHQGGRWTDVLRLVPGRRFVIGRASTCHVVVRSDRCSRQHAELFLENQDWVLRDLESRNGTIVGGNPVQRDHRLSDGDGIEIAHCQMSFVREISDAFSRRLGPVVGDQLGKGGGETDQQTIDDFESAMITDRRDSSSYLNAGERTTTSTPQVATVGHELFHLAFHLARCESVRDAATTALEGLATHTEVTSGALLIDRLASASQPVNVKRLEVVATLQRGERSYRRMPDLLANSVIGENEAVLARNIHNDETLASPDSRGELSTTSMICAPVRLGKSPIGLLHVYCGHDERNLTSEDLEFVVAVAEILSLAIRSLQLQSELADSLSQSRRRVNQLREQLGDTTKIVGDSEAIQSVKAQVQRAGPTSATVMIRGESGTGKELVAAALHQVSPRNDAPFVCMNCAALSPTLLESELFGHEKGSFTGATDRKLGKFEMADGGTLVLDEIGEMSLEIQAKFLRVLEGHPFERVGGNKPIKVDVRVVAATNRNLEKAVQENLFRADLYYRLHVVEINIPPLREREDDILRIADFFLDRFALEMGRKVIRISEAGRCHLMNYPWPGNVRELKNAIERAVVLCPNTEIDVDDLTLSNISLISGEAISSKPKADFHPESLEDLEKGHILAVLKSTAGNKSRAASVLGIERSTLDRKIRRYKMDPMMWKT